MSFKEKVLRETLKVPAGEFSTYKKIASLSGKPRAFRAVGQILAHNTDKNIPCHRIIKSNGDIGSYYGNKNLAWRKAALLLKEGAVGILPTDTIYGIVGRALNKKTVEKIYSLKKRNKSKPMIILISGLSDLAIFSVRIKEWQIKSLQKMNFKKKPISFILPCRNDKFRYLHRGRESLAFRIPVLNKTLLEIISISGPLVAPSANIEGFPPSKTIKEARRYFGNQAFYLDGGELLSHPSKLINLTSNPPKILRG